MLLTVALCGITFLLGIAVALGVERGARSGGRRGLAVGRRKLAELGRELEERAEAMVDEGRELYDWEGQLILAAESGRCPACELRRLRGQRPAD